MWRVVLPITLTVLVAGCASEAERYHWNLAHAYVCPMARFLTQADVDEIARVVAHATPQVIMTIESLRGSRIKLDVTTCYRGATWSDNRDVYGFCVVEKIDGGWKVTQRVTDLDPALAHMTACAE